MKEEKKTNPRNNDYLVDLPVDTTCPGCFQSFLYPPTDAVVQDTEQQHWHRTCWIFKKVPKPKESK